VSTAPEKITQAIAIRDLGLQEYEPLWRAMQRYTDERDAATRDEIWFTEHPPVFTLGLNASRDHLLDTGDIPVVQIDRGGQVTYHGPGMAARPDAPGVYVADTKFASVGLRIRRSASYHGMALNVAVDMEPFLRINPCGYAGLEMTDLATLGGDSDLDIVRRKFLPHFLAHLGMDDVPVMDAPGRLPDVSGD
jgi:lipoyl(octanoyl) transferase